MGETQFFHGSALWAYHEHGKRGHLRPPKTDPDDVRVQVCLVCPLPPDACYVDPECPFYRHDKGCGVTAAMTAERAERKLKEWTDASRLSDG